MNSKQQRPGVPGKTSEPQPINNSNKYPYFRFGLRGSKGSVDRLLAEYPLPKARNSTVKEARVLAVNAVLSNIITDTTLYLRNFSDLRSSERGFSRIIFSQVLNHLCDHGLLTREGKGFSRSIIIYSPQIMRYVPDKIVYYPPGTIIIHKKKEGRKVAKINTDERRKLNSRLRAWWEFIRQHDIDTGLTTLDFKSFNDRETLVFGKPPLIKPVKTDVLPYIVFNDRDLTLGGRMYGAFWIGMKKELRRGILIDGSKTCDIDGKGMHVQLLYRLAGEPLPRGDMYIYTDKRRRITKGLMLLMMNTAKEFPPEIGRKRVQRTYRKQFGHVDGLEEYILELEGFHYKILPELYKPNWGRLQNTEAAIMLSIMEAAMEEDIVVLPVHDGCMCKLEHRAKVLQFFNDQGIEADENEKHLLPVPITETKALLKAYYELKKVA